jgi:hypothetical protein
VHPTLGIRRHFQAFSYASAFFQSDGVPPPAPARVTQTVGRWREKYISKNLREFERYSQKNTNLLFWEMICKSHFKD